MKLSRNRRIFGVLAGVAVTAVLHPSHADAATVFSATSGAAFTTDASFAQQYTIAGANQSYSISKMTFAINWYNISEGTQDLFLDFYTGASTDPSQANDFAGATFLMDEGFAISAPTANGGVGYTLTFSTPVVVPSNTFDIVASMTNSPGTYYSTAIGGIFSPGSPTVGSDPGFVWVDANEDGAFAGSEQSTTVGGGTTANIYSAITATAIAVPEPVSMTAVLGIAGIALGRRRSRASRA
jgi:hypothetical protein